MLRRTTGASPEKAREMTSSYRCTCATFSFVLLGLLGPLGCAETGGAGADSPAGTGGGLIGNPAPDFSVAKAVGSKGSISLSDLAGNVVVIDFWGTYCEPCKKSFPKLQDLSAKYGGSGLRVVAISEDEAEDKDKIAGFAQTYGAKFSIGWDEDKSVARHYKPETMPTSFIVDRKGIVRFSHVGYHDGEEVSIERELKELLTEK
jgi:cytochrome c biogenesis protein CcmG/thiol:disulfide interchange protein DsbE